MFAFIRRCSMHYSIYRGYPLPRFPALKNAGGLHAHTPLHANEPRTNAGRAKAGR
jgi:hypothetical protein